MKLFAKLLLATLVLALLLPFTILKNDQGKPLMNFSSFSLPDMPSFGGSSKITPSVSDFGGKDIFYKWYDAEGNVQFTTEPPADGIEYTVKGYDPNTNVIRSVKLPEPEIEEKEPSAPPRETTSVQPETNPYDAESIKKLFEDTNNIEKLMNQRLENQNSNINQ
jgi:hypothetical protein